MMRIRFQKLAHIFALLLAGCLMFRIYFALDGSEFHGGTVTGPIFNMCEAAIVFFIVGIALAYPWPRIGSVLGLVASLLSRPILVYFIAPGPFRAVFKGEYSVPLQSNFVWDTWSLPPAIAILIVILISVWNLLMVRRTQVQPAP